MLQPHTQGKRSLIYLTTYKGKKAIVKQQHPNTKVTDVIKKEAHWLKELNKQGIGPKLYTTDEKSITMEYLEGPTLEQWIPTATKQHILKALQNILEQCMTLDKLNITKQEMHNPYKHIIMKRNKPVMIDFERARKTPHPKNVTQYCQYLTSNTMQKLLEHKSIRFNKETTKKTAQAYKKGIIKTFKIKELS